MMRFVKKARHTGQGFVKVILGNGFWRASIPVGSCLVQCFAVKMTARRTLKALSLRVHDRI